MELKYGLLSLWTAQNVVVMDCLMLFEHSYGLNCDPVKFICGSSSPHVTVLGEKIFREVNLHKDGALIH